MINKEFIEKCQASRRECDTWYGRNFVRKISIYISFLFVKIGIKAMAVTTIVLFLGILSALAFSTGGKIWFFAGILLLQLWYVMDQVDGEVARYNEETSFTGMYFDKLVHYIVHPIVFMGIGVGLYRDSGQIFYMFAGLIGGLSLVWMGLVVDIKDLVVFGNKKSKVKPKADNLSDGDLDENRRTCSLHKRVFMVVYSLGAFPTIMNVISLFVILDLFLNIRTVGYVLYLYSSLLSMLWIFRLSVFVKERRVDKEILIWKQK
jgi:hypothetical protein